MDPVRSAQRAALVLATLLASEARSHAASAIGTLGSDALVKHDADFAPAARGAKIEAGDAIRAPDHRAVTIVLSDGVVLSLSPGATASVHAASWLPAEHPGAKAVRAYRVALADGVLGFVAPSDPAHPAGVLVTLPGGASVGAWRGAAEIDAQPGPRCAASIFEGQAIVGGGGQWRPVGGGASAVFVGGGPPDLRRAIPRPPAWSSRSSAIAVVRGDERAPVSLAWEPVDDAPMYRVDVARDEAMRDPVASDFVGAQAYATEALAAGTYYATVRAIGKDGVVGAATPARRLRVARVSLPATARALAVGTIVLPPSAPITLDDPSGLEIALQNPDATYEPVWSPATREIGMRGDAARLLRIRDAATHDESRARFRLVRRELQARVELSPRRPRWPDQPVDVVVRPFDPTGRLDAAAEPLTVEVRVDLEEVPLTWRRVDGALVARIEPRVPPGPWVVRVRVKDASGEAIGAGVLEVDGPRVDTVGRRVVDSTEVRVSR